MMDFLELVFHIEYKLKSDKIGVGGGSHPASPLLIPSRVMKWAESSHRL